MDAFLTSGATAVLIGWRDSTLDVDVKLVPDRDDVALSKAERGHVQDRQDIADLLAAGLVTAEGARAQFEEIRSLLFRFPAIDPGSFGAAVEELFPLQG